MEKLITVTALLQIYDGVILSSDNGKIWTWKIINFHSALTIWFYCPSSRKCRISQMGWITYFCGVITAMPLADFREQHVKFLWSVIRLLLLLIFDDESVMNQICVFHAEDDLWSKQRESQICVSNLLCQCLEGIHHYSHATLNFDWVLISDSIKWIQQDIHSSAAAWKRLYYGLQ